MFDIPTLLLMIWLKRDFAAHSQEVLELSLFGVGLGQIAGLVRPRGACNQAGRWNIYALILDELSDVALSRASKRQVLELNKDGRRNRLRLIDACVDC